MYYEGKYRQEGLRMKGVCERRVERWGRERREGSVRVLVGKGVQGVFDCQCLHQVIALKATQTNLDPLLVAPHFLYRYKGYAYKLPALWTPKEKKRKRITSKDLISFDKPRWLLIPGNNAR